MKSAEENKRFAFSTEQLENHLDQVVASGVTELSLSDSQITSHKGRLLHFLQKVSSVAPNLFVQISLDASVLDMDIARAASEIYCSLELPLTGTSKGGTFLFDKKFYANRATMLNNLGLVFGFDMDFASLPGDSVRAFRDRLDFALSLYPNHIDFPQLEERSSKADKPSLFADPKPTQTFSTQDIRQAKNCASALEAFYSYGRAVPWFLSVLKPLKMSASRFFQDFSEWQHLNNCGRESQWKAEAASHAEIEKMQLTFLRFKYEEKKVLSLFDAVSDIVRINGAFARCAGEGEESVLELNYNPEDLLSPFSQNIVSFSDNVCMEKCRVKVFATDEGVDFRMV